jgi:rod shape-determining protein MreD
MARAIGGDSMRWVPFAVIAVAGLILQSSVAPRIDIWGVRPDWLLVVVVVFAMHAHAADAAVGAWLIGATADLMTIERLGLLSLSYLVAAMIVSSVRDYLFRRRAITQFFVTMLICFTIRSGWVFYRVILYDSAESFVRLVVVDSLIASLYTAMWAPLLHCAVLSKPGWFGLLRQRYTHAGLDRIGEARV